MKLLHSIYLKIIMWCAARLEFQVVTFRTDSTDPDELDEVVAIAFGCTDEDLLLHAHDIIREGFNADNAEGHRPDDDNT